MARQALLYSGLALLILSLILFVAWAKSNGTQSTAGYASAALFLCCIGSMRTARIIDKAAMARPSASTL